MEKEAIATAETNDELVPAGTAGTGATRDAGSVGAGETKAKEEKKENEVGGDGQDGGKDRTEGAKETQSKEMNAKYARERRESEMRNAIESAKKQAAVTATIEALGGKNPYTGEEMKDEEDVEEFLLQRKIEKEGGDPVADLSRRMKEKLRSEKKEEAIKRAEKAQKEASEETERAAWFREDGKRFREAHPDVDFKEILNDEGFAKFAEKRIGNESLTVIYDDYQKSIKDEKAKKDADYTEAKKNASPGALTGNKGSGEQTFFTPEQVRAMSKEEVHKHYEAIKKSMMKWKN